MDLNVLFAPQIKLLRQSYAELGYAPERLQSALQTAIDGEVERSAQEIKSAKDEIANLTLRCVSYQTVLDEPKAKSIVNDNGDQTTTLLVDIQHLQAELDRLQSIYSSRKAQVDKLVNRIEEYRPVLGDKVPKINLDSPSNHSTTVPTLPRPSELHAILSSCGEEVRRRSTELEEHLSMIVQLWSDLWILPQSDSTFDAMVLHHLKIQPLRVELDQGRIEFAGVFEQTEDVDGVDLEATPTRKSGSERQLGSQVSNAKQKDTMSPTLENLALASSKLKELDAEKERRFELIQGLYDELTLLWKRFDVADEAVDDFVQENTGCTTAVIQAYERELKQMRELKAEHMIIFVSKIREDIAALWDQLLMTENERRESLPEFFEDLGDEEESGVEPTDELLALHEEKVKELSEELALKARPLELVRQYNKLLEEAHELEASAKDTSRLLGRGNGQKRDPGRLLREEKMRKRIKVLKPKIEDELMRSIPTWEEESGRPFCINGERFLDTVEIQPRSPKKRMRTVSSSVSIASATPQQSSAKRSRVESTQSASASVRRIMATPQSHNNGTLPPPSSTKSSHNPRIGIPASVGRIPPPRPKNGSLLQSVDTNRMASVCSNGSISSQATDRTIIVHNKANKLKRRGPSLLVEESLRNSTFTKSDYAKPQSTGAGTTVRPISNYPAKFHANLGTADESGPNWAVLDEDEESNLLS